MIAATNTPSRILPANGAHAEFLSPRAMAREAAKILAAKGIEVRPAALRHLVTRLIREGHTSLHEIEPFVITYADPTGERATARVMRGGS